MQTSENTNKLALDKIKRYKAIVQLLEIQKEHFGKLSDFKWMPMFLRAKYRLKAFALESEILAKNDFIRIYSERVTNTKYAENVLKPIKNE